MMNFKMRLALALAASAALIAPLHAQDGSSDEASWDGLVRTKVKRIDSVYLLPEADFRVYTKIMLEPTEVAFRRNWQRDQNFRAGQTLDGRVSDSDARRILDEARSGFEEIIRKAFQDEGFVIVTEPGEDVLRVRTSISDLDIVAPDVATSGRTRTYSREAGEATLTVEARDSLSGQLLGRSVDTETAGDLGSYLRNSMTNRADFERLFKEWAKLYAEGLVELRESSPAGAAVGG